MTPAAGCEGQQLVLGRVHHARTVAIDDPRRQPGSQPGRVHVQRAWRHRQDASRKDGNTISTTTTIYNGDRTTVIPPQGGVIKSTVTDPLGRTSEIDEYTAAPTLVTPRTRSPGSGTSPAAPQRHHLRVRRARQPDGTTEPAAPGAPSTTCSARSPPGRPRRRRPHGMNYDEDGNLPRRPTPRGHVSYTYDALSRKTGEYAAATSAQSASNEIASWVYDNSNNAVSGMKDPIGQLTTETSYSGGPAYTLQEEGFNEFGESLGETSPSSPPPGRRLAGSYSFGHAYNHRGRPALEDNYPAAGGLPPRPSRHATSYAARPAHRARRHHRRVRRRTSYDGYGDVTQEDDRDRLQPATSADTYDPHTGKLTDQPVTRSVDHPGRRRPGAVQLRRRRQPHLAGVHPEGSASDGETQCFQYNGLDQLSAAWTATDACAATPSGVEPLHRRRRPRGRERVLDHLDLQRPRRHDQPGPALPDRRRRHHHHRLLRRRQRRPHALTTAATTGGSTATSTLRLRRGRRHDQQQHPRQRHADHDLGRGRQPRLGHRRHQGASRLRLRRRRQPAAPGEPRLDHPVPAGRAAHRQHQRHHHHRDRGPDNPAARRRGRGPHRRRPPATPSRYPTSRAPASSTSTTPPRSPPGASSPPTAPPAAPPSPGSTTAASSTSPPTPAPAWTTSAPAPTTRRPPSSSPPTPSSTRPTRRTSTPTTTPKTTPSPTPTPPGCAPPARTTTCSRSGKCARTPRRPARPRSQPAPRSTPPPAPSTAVYDRPRASCP